MASPWRAAEAVLVGERDPLHRGLGVAAARGEGAGRVVPRGGGGVGVAAQLVDGGERAQRVGEPGVGGPGGDDLAQGARGLGQLAGELAAARVALERLRAPGGIVVVRPQLERLAERGRGVAVGVHRLRVGRRAEQRGAGVRLRVRAEPVRRDVARRRAAALERRRDPAVQRAAAHPRQVGVERLARQRMAERARAVGALARDPGLEQLGHACLAGELRHDPQVEALARDRGHLDRLAARLRELGDADHHRVADRVGERHVAVARELEQATGRAAARR